jgi:hypothetical protein
MPGLPIKVRTLESYLAGVGASSALIAGAFVGFVLLIGIVTFNAWPTGSDIFSRGPGDVSVDTSVTTTPPARAAKGPNLVKLLGGGAPPATAPANTGGAGGQAPTGPSIGTGNPPGQSGPQGSNPGGGGQQGPAQPVQPVQPAQPVGGTSSSQNPSPNLLQDTVSNVGNTLQSDTDSLSNTLGGQDTLLGGLVGGAGQTLNNTLQSLSGN